MCTGSLRGQVCVKIGGLPTLVVLGTIASQTTILLRLQVNPKPSACGSNWAWWLIRSGEVVFPSPSTLESGLGALFRGFRLFFAWLDLF